MRIIILKPPKQVGSRPFGLAEGGQSGVGGPGAVGEAVLSSPAGRSLDQTKSGLPPPQVINQAHTIAVMGWGTVELEPEVGEWYHKLDRHRRAQAFFHFELLEDRGTSLGMPYTRQLDGKLWELRFHCGDVQQRVTYWIAADRRIVLLTVFRKTRSNEAAEVRRAKRAMVRCQAENHTPDEEEVA